MAALGFNQRGIPSKQMQINESKMGFICFLLFFRIQTSQGATGEKIKKSTHVSSCVQNVSNAFSSSFSLGGAGRLDSDEWKTISVHGTTLF